MPPARRSPNQDALRSAPGGETVSSDFGEMYARQRDFQHVMYGDIENLPMEERISITREMALHLQSEVVEFMNEMAWKAKRRQSPHIVRGNLLDEAVDVVKMALTLPILWGFTAEEFMDGFRDKSMVVEQRYAQEFPLYKIIEQSEALAIPSVVALDIDGVLGDWPFCFYQFIESQHPGEMIFRRGSGGEPIDESTQNPYEALANNPLQIHEWKDEYRQSGAKRSLPVVEGAVAFTKELRRLGLHVVLLTARPYKMYCRIFADTMHWLDSNGFAYDAILWGEDKEARLAEEFTAGSVAAFVDDNPLNVDRVRASGFNAYLLERPYNAEGFTFDEILKSLMKAGVPGGW
jgi:hypothetical protein